MSNNVLIFVIVYSISVEATLPLNESVENSTTTYSTTANLENVTKPVTNHDAESSTTIKTNQKSENISEPAVNDDFLTFWGSNPLDVLKKVSKFSKSDENAVIVPDDVLASSNRADDGENNTNNFQHETQMIENDYSKKYSLLNLFGIDDDDDEPEPEYDDPNYDDYDGYNYDPNENTTNDEGDESDDSNESIDYKPYGGSEEKDAKNNDLNSNSDDYIKSESEAYNLYGDVVDDEGKSYEDDNSLPVNDVSGKLSDTGEGTTNMKFNKGCSGNKTSPAFTLHHIISWAVLLLHFNIEFL